MGQKGPYGKSEGLERNMLDPMVAAKAFKTLKIVVGKCVIYISFRKRPPRRCNDPPPLPLPGLRAPSPHRGPGRLREGGALRLQGLQGGVQVAMIAERTGGEMKKRTCK